MKNKNDYSKFLKNQLNKVIIIGIFLILLFGALSFISNRDYVLWKQKTEGLPELGSVTLNDYEVLSKPILCKICNSFYCDRNFKAGCDYCTRECKWYRKILD